MTLSRSQSGNPASPNASPGGRRIFAGGVARAVGRVGLGAALLLAGTGHLTTQRQEFQAQVPNWIPLDPDFVVLASGFVELGLGAALIVAPRVVRPLVGAVTAAFFVAIFPGNIAQFVEGKDGFGLNTDRARFIRLLFQPLLVIWAVWSTGAWRSWRERKSPAARLSGSAG